jgi:ankyrin repeat protein
MQSTNVNKVEISNKKFKNLGMKIDYDSSFLVYKFYIENKFKLTDLGIIVVKTAAETGNIEVIRYLLENGIDIHAYNDYLICSAIGRKNLDLFKFLVEKNPCETYQKALLNNSAIYNYLDGVKHMVELFDIRVRSIALTYAARFGNIEIVKFLKDHGAVISFNTDSALVWASLNGHLNIVKYLVKNGAIINADNNNALKAASENGHLEVVEYLILMNSDLFSELDDALLCASTSGHLNVVKCLLQFGANPNYTNATSKSKHMDLIKNLYKIEISSDSLLLACSNGHLDVVMCLIENGAKLSSTRFELQVAYENKHSKIVNYLVKKFSNVKDPRNLRY